MLLATILFALTFAAATTIKLGGNEWGLWGLVASAGLATRYVGWFCGVSLGRVTRHALAWFVGVAGCALAIVAIEFRDRPSIGRLMQDLPDGLGAAALIYGLVVATLLECVFVLSTVTRKSTGG
ncbi:hypothetical protein [Stieleria varia]|uniref:Uncharacterized protein n=1 Tax=Stieleria varia TaxID=2528005 RepID=A0A5C6B3F4_9BACT|nr:hypothetical protein [Stieleria varia]TWU05806.1 hypothetical protein Pla52n_15210 [Stieleria varia]